MKVSRSYWLGLGSGLILSAILSLVIPPQLGQPVISQQTKNQSQVKENQRSDSLATGNLSPVNQQNQSSQDRSPVQVSSKVDQNFIVPQGASSERIADLLLTQGLIKDKETFLMTAHQLGVERQFKAGTFILSLDLTTEELIHRLTK